MENPTTDLLALKRVRALVRSGSARAVRIGAGLTRTEVARAAKVSARSLARWESGERLPHGAAALRYGAILDSLMDEHR